MCVRGCLEVAVLRSRYRIAMYEVRDTQEVCRISIEVLEYTKEVGGTYEESIYPAEWLRVRRKGLEYLHIASTSHFDVKLLARGKEIALSECVVDQFKGVRCG